MEPLLVADDLDRHTFSRLVISALQHLAEGTFTEHAQNLVAIAQMITKVDQVITTVVIIAVIVLRRIGIVCLL